MREADDGPCPFTRLDGGTRAMTRPFLGLQPRCFAVHDLMGRLHDGNLTLVVLLALIGVEMVVGKAV